MGILEQQIWAGVAIMVIGAIVIGGVKALIRNAMMAFQCLKDGQKVITDQCQAMSLQLKMVEGKFEKGEQWMQMHHDSDTMQFSALTEQVKECREMLSDVPCKK